MGWVGIPKSLILFSPISTSMSPIMCGNHNWQSHLRPKAKRARHRRRRTTNLNRFLMIDIHDIFLFLFRLYIFALHFIPTERSFCTIAPSPSFLLQQAWSGVSGINTITSKTHLDSFLGFHHATPPTKTTLIIQATMGN